MVTSYKVLFLPVALILFLLSCAPAEKEQLSSLSNFAPNPLAYSLVSRAGDTIPTGEPITVKVFPPHPDSIIPPVSFPLRGVPKTYPAQTKEPDKIHPQITILPEELPTTVPGEGGFAVPSTKPIVGKILPFRFRPPTETAPFRFNDDAEVNIKYLDVEQGVSSSYVSEILEDSRSNLWVGTSGGGVMRFDGINLSVLNHEELGIYGINPILEDSKKRIWFKVSDLGAVCYDGDRFIHFGEEQGLTSNGVRSIIEDKLGRIWIGAGEGANCIEFGEDGIRGEITHFTQREGLVGIGQILDMIEDAQGNLWFAGQGGFVRYDGSQFKTISQKEGLPTPNGYRIMEDHKGQLWLGTSAGVSRLKADTFTHFTYQEGLAGPNVTDLVEDEKGRIWVSSSGGVSMYDGKRFQIYSVKDAGVRMQFVRILEDSYGNFWFGTQGKGLIRLNLKNNFQLFQQFPSGENSNIWSLMQDRRNNYWFGTGGKGIYIYDGQQFMQLSQKEGLSNDVIRTLKEDSKENIWIGTMNGLTRFTPDKTGEGGIFTQFAKAAGFNGKMVNDVMEDDKGYIWLGSDAGLTCFTENTFIDYTASELLPRISTYCIYKSRSGDLWLGTSRGAIKVEIRENAQEAEFTFFTPEVGLGLSGVRDIMEDKAGNLWFAGHEGVYYYDHNTFSKVPLKDSWWNHSYRNMGHYNSLIRDSLDRIWVSREKEISVIVPKKQEDQGLSRGVSTGFSDKFQIFDFGKEDGIRTVELYARSVLLNDQNHLWWGGIPYCIRLDLDEFKLPEEPPNVDLNHIEVRQQFVDFRALSDSVYRDTVENGKILLESFDAVVAFRNYPTTLDLPHRLNHLTFHFSAIDWADPSALKYRFKIDGGKEGWSQPQSSPRADFRNLPSGKHTLMVQAIGKAQKWSEPFRYSFRIRPPWWQSWWAYGLWLLLLSWLLYALYRFQLNRRLELAEKERLLELDQVKSRLFTNITHEFRTPLTIILGMVEQVRTRPERWLQEGSEMIKRNGRQLLHLVNQMLDLARVESATLSKNMVQANVIAYLMYLMESFQSLAKAREIQFHFIPGLPVFDMDFDPDHLLQIVSNLLSNALKFTPIGEHIYVEVEKIIRSDKPLLSIKISDTGPGMAPEQLAKVFDRFFQADTSGERKHGGAGIGLALTKELVGLHGGSIETSSQQGYGSQFTVLLPVSNQAPLENRSADELLKPQALELVTSELIVAEAAKQNNAGTLRQGTPELLIVEDNTDVVRYLETCLKDHYQLTVARDGAEGIQTAIERVPDIIISDVMMPGRSGFDLCHTLKNDERTSHIPIVLLTAKGDLDSKLVGLSRGADVYLPKPFYQKELLAHLANLITLRQKLQLHYQRALKDPGEHRVSREEDPFLKKVLELVEQHLDRSDLEISWLAEQLLVSRVQLFRKIKALTGKSPSQFIRSYRLGKARQMLRTTHDTVAEVAYKTGFSDPGYFSKTFKKEFGVSPSEIKNG